MRAAVLFAPGQPLEVCDLEIDQPQAREVLVRVAASGLCHSDLHYMTGDLPGQLPVVLGHEVAGIVEAAGSEVTAFQIGDHVVSCALTFCGHCNQCVSGRSQTCSRKPGRSGSDPARLTHRGKPVAQGARIGGFAEQVLLHENSIVRIDRAVPLDRAALLGCGVLTGMGAVFNSAKVSPGSIVVVIGCGGVGLTIIQAARIAGARQIIAIDANSAKEALARQFGATEFLKADDDNLASVRELTSGGANFVFEAIGVPSVVAQGIQMLAVNGLMTVVGAIPANATIPLPGLGMIYNEWRVQGTLFGSSAFTRDIPFIVGLYQRGLIDLDTMVSRRIDLAEVNEGFADMAGGATQARNVITFNNVLAGAAASA